MEITEQIRRRFRNDAHIRTAYLVSHITLKIAKSISALRLIWVISLTKIKMLLQYCRNVAGKNHRKMQFVATIVLATFVAIILEAILLPEMLPELGHAQRSFLFNFHFSNLEGNGVNKENNLY